MFQIHNYDWRKSDGESDELFEDKSFITTISIFSELPFQSLFMTP